MQTKKGHIPVTLQSLLNSRSLRYLRLKLLRQHRLRHRANLLVNNLALLEYQQGRDVANTKLRRRLRILVDVQLGNNRLAFIVAAQFLYYRSNHFAMSAPFSPEIHQDGLIRIDGLVEVR